VIASPSIGTGVSIDLKGHFDAVIGIFAGAIADNDIRQALSRVREAVPRLVWCARFGLGKIGSGSGYWKTLFKDTSTASREVICKLLQLDMDPDQAADPVTLRAWSKIAARTNASHFRLFDNLRANLIAEGHSVTVIGAGDKEQAREIAHEQAEIAEQLTEEQCQAVAAAAPLEASLARELEDKASRTKTEREQLERHQITERYGLEVSPELVHKDRDGWYGKIRLHFLATLDLERTKARDVKRLADSLAAGGGELYLPDTLRDLSAGRVATIQLLGVLPLIGGVELTNASPEAVAIHNAATGAAAQIKRLLGVTIRAEASPIETVARLLKCLGIPLSFVRKEGKRGNQTRVYRALPPDDCREKVWDYWTIKDRLKTVSELDTVVTTSNKDLIVPSGDYSAPGKLATATDTTRPTAPQLPAVAFMARSSSLAVSPIGETTATRVTSSTKSTNSPQLPPLPSWRPPAKGEAQGRRVWVAGQILPVISTAGNLVTVATGLHRLEDVLLVPLEDPRGRPLTYGLEVA
jgi:hypothetical protein